MAFPFLLESVDGPGARARYDILFHYTGDSLIGQDSRSDFLRQLDQWQDREAIPSAANTSLPFRGGWFLYLGYELAGTIEPRLRLPLPEPAFPVAFAARCPAAVIRDRKLDLCFALCEPERAELLPLLRQVYENPGTVKPAPPGGRLVEEDPALFIDAVERVHEYILAGDVFQVNLSRGWSLQKDADSAAIYAALRQGNPAPFAGLALWQGAAVISSSPERLAEVRGGWVQTRPIAGTRPRSSTVARDRALGVELLDHPKERAEHIMLIDLERNDLGRVCISGSVEVNELMVLESYRYVHHIVSNVRGRLRPDTTPGDIIAAVFPGGTITGCPKVRCMEIIAELEQRDRGPYTGSMGYLNRDGDMDLNILIRSMFHRDGELQLRAGAGIVADSVGQLEVEETRSKARGLLRAMGVESPPIRSQIQ